MNRERILGSVPPSDFIGRAGTLQELGSHAAGENRSSALLLLGAPGNGVSEILRQYYDINFFTQDEIIPVYFSARDASGSLKTVAARFLHTFLRQAVAFRRGDPSILDSAAGIDELSRLAPPADGFWIDRIAEIAENADDADDETFIRSCFSAPLRAAAAGARIFLMFDDVEDAAFIEEIKEIYAGANVPFVLAGKRRFVFDAAFSGKTRLDAAEILRVEPLSFGNAELLALSLSETYRAAINEQTRDLIAVQFDGNPALISFLFQAAGDLEAELDSFKRVEQIYTNEIFGGRIAKYYDDVFNRLTNDVGTQKKIVALLNDSLDGEKEKVPVETWQKRLALRSEDLKRAIDFLNTYEIIRLTSNLIEPMSENAALTDYLRGRFRLESGKENRALVVGEFLNECMKRAPQTMAKFYRRAAAIRLRELLSAFDCQLTPAALLDYAAFKEKLKGADKDEIDRILAGETEKITLPQIVYAAHTVAFYPPFEKLAEKERSAVALGFEGSRYTDDAETVWIAAEIDSKLEAAADVAEFWCDRLEMVALVSNFKRYKLWLIAPEGFSPEALHILAARNAIGSSRKQVDLLIDFLGAGAFVNEEPKADEYEMIIPMGEDTEMIAVHAVEEIARRHHFAPKSITQIKTALVEACINAAEHSKSPERKIHLKFAIEEDKIVITVSNRGLRLADKETLEVNPDQGRRGWGLKLMRTLMDEVKLEQVDDGTRISMTKYLRASPKK